MHKNAVEDLRQIITEFPDAGMFVIPDVPAERLTKAIQSYAFGAQPNRVLFLYDNTLWGSAKNGFCLTSQHLYWRNAGEEPSRISLRRIKHAIPAAPGGFLDTPHVNVNDRKLEANSPELAVVLAKVILLVRDACRRQQLPKD